MCYVPSTSRLHLSWRQTPCQALTYATKVHTLTKSTPTALLILHPLCKPTHHYPHTLVEAWVACRHWANFPLWLKYWTISFFQWKMFPPENRQKNFRTPQMSALSMSKWRPLNSSSWSFAFMAVTYSSVSQLVCKLLQRKSYLLDGIRRNRYFVIIFDIRKWQDSSQCILSLSRVLAKSLAMLTNSSVLGRAAQLPEHLMLSNLTRINRNVLLPWLH